MDGESTCRRMPARTKLVAAGDVRRSCSEGPEQPTRGNESTRSLVSEKVATSVSWRRVMVRPVSCRLGKLPMALACRLGKLPMALPRLYRVVSDLPTGNGMAAGGCLQIEGM